jgi:phage portal protein BeeE
MKSIKQWIEARRLNKAQEIIESYGLSVVMLKKVGDATYLIDADGAYMKLQKKAKQ